MNFEKIKEMLKNRKVQVIAGTVVGVLVVTLAGTMILHNKNIENKSVAVSKNTENKVEDEKEEITNEDKDAKEQLEELKNTDTSNLSDEEKKDLENKIADMENKIANEAVTEENNEVASNTSNSTSNNSSSSSSGSSSSTTSSNSSTSNSSQSAGSSSSSKPSSGSSSSSSSSSNSGSTSGSTSNKEESHNWVPITSVVHHDEEGHWEDVVVTPAWTEEVPVYETKEAMICNDCGEDITNLSQSEYEEHMMNHILNGGKGSWRTEWKQVQVGTNTVTHEALVEKRWVIDKAAWDETVVTGYKCTIHGEIK